MTTKELNAKMLEHRKNFDLVFDQISSDVNEFLKQNPDHAGYYSFQAQETDRLVDALCLSGAWIRDRLSGKKGVPGTKEYRGSLTKRIRKALGYNI